MSFISPALLSKVTDAICAFVNAAVTKLNGAIEAIKKSLNDYVSNETLESKLEDYVKASDIAPIPSAESPRTYEVQIAPDDELVVNVPWISMFNDNGNIIKEDLSKNPVELFNANMIEYDDMIFDDYRAYILDEYYCEFAIDRMSADVLTTTALGGATLRFSIYAKLLNEEDDNLWLFLSFKQRDGIYGGFVNSDQINKSLSKNRWRHYYVDFPIESSLWDKGEVYIFNIAAMKNGILYTGNNKVILTAPKLEIISSANPPSVHSLDYAELSESQMDLQQGGMLNGNETSSLPKDKGELLSSKNITIEANKQYYNDVKGRIVSDYIGFDNYSVSATILSKYPLTFEGDNVLVPSRIPDAEYLMYTVKYMQTSDIKYVLVVTAESMSTNANGLIGADVVTPTPSIESQEIPSFSKGENERDVEGKETE